MTEPSDTGRNERGRFSPGNPGGPGGSRRHATALRRAAEQAVTEEHVQAMVRKAVRMALEGNLTAMKVALERTIGGLRKRRAKRRRCRSISASSVPPSTAVSPRSASSTRS